MSSTTVDDCWSPFIFFDDDDDDGAAVLLAVTLKARVDAEADPGAVEVLRKAAVAVAVAARAAACIIASRGAWARGGRMWRVWSVWRTKAAAACTLMMSIEYVFHPQQFQKCY